MPTLENSGGSNYIYTQSFDITASTCTEWNILLVTSWPLSLPKDKFGVIGSDGRPREDNHCINNDVMVFVQRSTVFTRIAMALVVDHTVSHLLFTFAFKLVTNRWVTT